MSESMSLGDLCHTKALLRLPLKSFTSSVDGPQITPSQAAANNDDKQADKSPAPVFPAESIDSLYTSSLNSADKPDHFPIFDSEKTADLSTSCSSMTSDAIRLSTGEWDIPDDLTACRESTKVITDLDDAIDPVNATVLEYGNGKHLSDIRKSNRQSDSTDEDSGIESIMRIIKEVA